MQPDVPIAQGVDTVRGMLAFVGAHGGRGEALARLPGQHLLRGLAFRRAGGGLQPPLDTQPVPIFHQHMPGDTQLGFLA